MQVCRLLKSKEKMTAGVTEAHSSSTAVQVIDLGSQRSAVTKK
jgi:hypothetical protein